MEAEQTESIIGRPVMISDIDTITLSQLPKVTALSATDLIEIDRNGTGATVTYANLVVALTASLGPTGIEETLKLSLLCPYYYLPSQSKCPIKIQKMQSTAPCDQTLSGTAGKTRNHALRAHAARRD